MSPELDAIHDLLSILNLNPPKFMHFVSDAAPVISEICFNYCLHTKFIKLAFHVLYLTLLPTARAVLCHVGGTSQSAAATGKKKGETVKVFLTLVDNYDCRK